MASATSESTTATHGTNPVPDTHSSYISISSNNGKTVPMSCVLKGSNYGTPTMSNGADATCEIDGLGGTKAAGDQSPIKAASDSLISGLSAQQYQRLLALFTPPTKCLANYSCKVDSPSANAI
ncbi:hypothetical protein Ancab_028425 [Ancistrocladus abbreviatus]